MAQFFYGTLRDPELLAIVLGRAVVPVSAHLPGHAVCHAGEAAFPLIVAGGGGVDGLLAEGLSADDLARLQWYEGAFGYELRAVTVKTADGARAAQVWFPPQGQSPGAAWSLRHWQDHHAPLVRATAREVMAAFGRIPADRLPRMWHIMESRAQSRLTGARAADSALSGMARADVTVIATRRPYQNFFAVEEYDLTFRQFDGTTSPQIERGVFLSADAALVLPYDPRRDAVLVIEQFRSGPFARGDAHPWCLEPIAGLIDGGETPEAAARRETLEEANLTVDRLIHIGRGYASPGDSTGFYNMFCAPCDLPDAAAGVGGLASESENIRSHILPYARFLDLLDGGHLNVTPLIAMGHWLARHRDGLRAAY